MTILELVERIQYCCLLPGEYSFSFALQFAVVFVIICRVFCRNTGYNPLASSSLWQPKISPSASYHLFCCLSMDVLAICARQSLVMILSSSLFLLWVILPKKCPYFLYKEVLSFAATTLLCLPFCLMLSLMFIFWLSLFSRKCIPSRNMEMLTLTTTICNRDFVVLIWSISFFCVHVDNIRFAISSSLLMYSYWE